MRWHDTAEGAPLAHNKTWPNLCQNIFFEINIIKLFWNKFAHSFGKVDLFILMQQIMLVLIKWSSLQKSMSKISFVKSTLKVDLENFFEKI